MKFQIVVMTAGLMVCLTGSAWAQPAVYQDVRSPDAALPVSAAVLSVASNQDLRSPDAALPVSAAVPPVETAPAPAATSSEIPVPVDGGLSAFMIVLISLGGAAALAGAAFAALRLAHHRPPVA
jgi:hypothetical protein